MPDVALFERVASRLTGRPVEVRFQEPPIVGCRGLADRDKDGNATITIEPGMDQDNELFVFLHEVAHIKLHYNHMEPSDFSSLPQRSVPQPKDGEPPPGRAYQENQANVLANVWKTWGKTLRSRDVDWYLGCLMALEKYPAS